jgi:hypothetical protein
MSLLTSMTRTSGGDAVTRAGRSDQGRRRPKDEGFTGSALKAPSASNAGLAEARVRSGTDSR